MWGFSGKRKPGGSGLVLNKFTMEKKRHGARGERGRRKAKSPLLKGCVQNGEEIGLNLRM